MVQLSPRSYHLPCACFENDKDVLCDIACSIKTWVCHTTVHSTHTSRGMDVRELSVMCCAVLSRVVLLLLCCQQVNAFAFRVFNMSFHTAQSTNGSDAMVSHMHVLHVMCMPCHCYLVPVCVMHAAVACRSVCCQWCCTIWLLHWGCPCSPSSYSTPYIGTTRTRKSTQSTQNTTQSTHIKHAHTHTHTKHATQTPNTEPTTAWTHRHHVMATCNIYMWCV